MKKILCLMLLLSVVSLGMGSFEASKVILETHFESEYPFITDGNTKLEDIEYDLTISEGNALLELEIGSKLEDGKWWELDKEVFEEFILKLVRSIRSEVDAPDLDVTVFVKLHRDFEGDQILFNKTYYRQDKVISEES